MSIIIKEQSEPSVDPGTYLARCFRIADVGTQEGEIYDAKRKLIISWELPHERIEVDGKDLPRSVSKWYTFSLNEKATLRKDLECWRGRAFTPEELKGFELNKVLGTACQLTIVHTPKGQVRVAAVSGIPRGTIVPEVENPKVEFSYEQGNVGPAYAALPDWLKTILNKCSEWAKPANPVDPPAAPHQPDNLDDVPF